MKRLSLSLACLLLASGARAEEGMWTFDNLPLKQMKAAYGFEPTQAWLDHLRLASLRFPGGSGSFVSADGLVLTNHHVVRGYVQRLSTPQRDLLKDGFVARARAEELKVPGLELLQLERLEDISARVAKARAGLDAAEALRAREREVARAREELRTRTGLTVEPVVLYQGGETWLYAYRKYTDVRLVMAPELAVARFGGDHDNFTFPRHHLDFALLRAYEKGEPVRPKDFLRWSAAGLGPGALSFVSGHPGSTSRLFTVAQMAYARDLGTPLQIAGMERRRAVLEAFAARGFEARALVGGQIYGIDNGLKATRGYFATLKDATAMAEVARREAELRARVEADPALKALAGDSWARVEAALQEQRKLAREQALVNTRGSELLGTALHLLRLPEEAAKPEAQRLPEYADAALPALRKRLAEPRPTPFHPGLEIHLFTAGLQEAREQLGEAHPFVQALLAGRTPEAVAEAAVKGSKLQDPAEVARLLAGGRAALASCQDPMLELARKLDGFQRALREKVERLVEGPLKEHTGRIAQARFRATGKETCPDATFTLRLSYGTLASYPANGTLQQPVTTLHGLFDRFYGWGGTTDNLGRDTWRLPSRWLQARQKLDLDLPYNLATSHDIIGGNSGSPVVDVKGELVGLAFDGNLESLGGRYVYDGRANRTVCVDARAIREVLAKVYDAQPLVDELNGK